MAKNKKEEVKSEVKINEPEKENIIPAVEQQKEEVEKKLFKYDIGDEVYVMENNKVTSFVIGKRIILSYFHDGGVVDIVYYDPNGWNSLKASYTEDQLYPTKQALLKSL